MNRCLSVLALAAALMIFGMTADAQQRRTRGTGTGRASPNKPVAPVVVNPADAGTASNPPASSTGVTAAAATVGAGDSCGCESLTPDVLAVVNGVKLTIKDIDTLETPLERERVKLEAEVVEARQRELDKQIGARLIEAEAKKRNLSVVKLLAQEVSAKVTAPTEAEAQTFYDQNRAQIQGDFKDVKEQIIGHLSEQRRQAQERIFIDRLRAAAQVKVLVGKITPPATAADRARVLATVNGQPITTADVEENMRPQIFNVRDVVYKQRLQALNAKINNVLLEQEATKRQVTAPTLFETEVHTKIVKVTEADAQNFYNQNKARIGPDFAPVKDRIMQHLQEQENLKAVAGFADRLRQSASVQTFLTPPEPPVYDIPVDDQPVKGNATAKVTIVEFTDFQCPACAQAQPVVERLAQEYGDRVKLVVRDFPLRQHANAFRAAEAAEAAREQGKYWEYVTILFGNQSALDVPQLKEYATRLKLDRQKFDGALDSGKYADAVRRDLQDGDKFGVNATPTLFINGRHVTDISYENLKALIDGALKSGAGQ